MTSFKIEGKGKRMSFGEVKPSLRGYFHRGAFFAFLVIGFILLFMAKSHISRLSVSIYIISLLNLYGISSVLHMTDWKEEWVENRVVKIDHASIFLLICGSYTPVCLCCISSENNLNLKICLCAWIVAISGVLKCIFWTNAPRVFNVIFYMLCGLIIAPFLAKLKYSLSVLDLVMFLFGGLQYLVGGVIFGAKYPDPWPHYFGFHEIFHILTITANIFFLIPISKYVIF